MPVLRVFNRSSRALWASRFPTTKRFTAIVQLLNAADPAHLSKVMGRLLGAIPGKGAGCFSEAESEQMCSLFSFNAEQLDLLLGGSAFIFEQAAYATTPPEDLRTELEAAGLGADAARVFSSAWQLGAAECVQRLKDQSVLAPLQLNGVDWQLCVGSAASSGARGQEPHALLQLELAPPDGASPSAAGSAAGSSVGASGEAPRASADSAGQPPASQAVHLRLGQEEMSALLGKLDLIQAQMDAIA